MGLGTVMEIALALWRMLVWRLLQFWHLLQTFWELEVMALFLSWFNDKDVKKFSRDWEREKEGHREREIDVASVTPCLWTESRKNCMKWVWLEVLSQIPFLGFESIPALSVVRVQVFSPVGEADVFSNNEKVHMAKTHLRGGQSPESLLISNAVCNRRKKTRRKVERYLCPLSNAVISTWDALDSPHYHISQQ